MTCSKGHTVTLSDLFCRACGEKLVKIETDPDYITLMACVNPQRAIVAVMHYDKADDGYRIRKCSEPLSQKGAATLAESWAAALNLEIR